MVELRTPTDDDFVALTEFDARVFGSGEYSEKDRAATRPVLDLDRYRIAVDTGQIVGAAGSDAFEMTLPGGTTTPMAGVTWVGVAVTHRRQGLLRRLMDAVHDDITDRSEPLACLTASEGGIYERFGYGIATRRRLVEVDRRRAQLAERFRPEPGSVRLVDGDVATAISPIWDRYRLTRAGEVSRSPAWTTSMLQQAGKPSVTAVHGDGFARWKVTAAWNEGHPSHELRVIDFAASTPDAHAALWHTILGVDLVGPVRSTNLPVDDPLPYLLDDQRALRTTGHNDGVWCKPMDVAAAFRARRYPIEDSFVLEVDGDRYRIDGAPDGASCKRSRRRADLVTDQAGAGALLLGGITASALVAGRRATVRDEATMHRLDSFLTMAPTPHSTTGF
ncbi:MAG: GNAT family N-acetyltransferase [Ilumatobacteraceae bacterium]